MTSSFIDGSLSHVITDCGDSAVIGGIAVISALYLAVTGCRRGAWLLLFSLLASAVLISVIKILLIGCGIHWHIYSLRSPSGHTALSTAVLGSLAILLSHKAKGLWRTLPIIAVIPMIAAIAISRIALGYHDIAEVFVGLVIGVAVCVGMAVLLWKHILPPLDRPRLVLVVVLVAFALNGLHLPAEALVQRIAGNFTSYVSSCDAAP